MTKYAHSGKMANKSDWQPLENHLSEVGRLAAKFATPFGATAWAKAAGTLHDAGKAYPEFQMRLEGRHSVIDHSSAGARLACMLYPSDKVTEGEPLVPIIMGHHGGMPDTVQIEERISRDKDAHADDDLREEFAEYQGLLPEEDGGVRKELIPQGCRLEDRPSYLAFNVFALEHMLFSSVVDADWLDTERVRKPENYERRMVAKLHQQSLGVLLDNLESYRQEKKLSNSSNTPINQARAEMLAAARKAACAPRGFFSLNMPTGSGKTLTSLEFALRHAIENGQTRIIYAIPFMSIVEQNAQILKKAVGAANVIEHFSSYDFGHSSRECDESGSQYEAALRERMLIQNWDAPVVVTTNVQLFESLFSNKPARSRKVHNVANSVIILDEAQSLPDQLLKPTLAMLESLVSMAKVSVVICTATQPMLESCFPFHSSVTEIIDEKSRHAELFSGRADFDITHVTLGERGGVSFTLGSLTEKLAREDELLCVVSSRRAASELYDSLSEVLPNKDGLFHLSALMVPEHRSKVLDEVRKRLKEGRTCRLISTQLVEAGVDVDFPIVFRELAGIDSILQAAGRCNREGRLGRKGHVVVFECEDFSQTKSKKQNWLTYTRELGRDTLAYAIERGLDPFGDEAVAYYFGCRHQTGELDSKRVFCCIADKEYREAYCVRGRFPYGWIADAYRFISEDEVGIFVPWGESGQNLLAAIESGEEWGNEIFPQAQRHSVSVQYRLYRKYLANGLIRQIEGFPVPVLEMRSGARQVYDEERGLLGPEEGEMETLVI